MARPAPTVSGSTAVEPQTPPKELGPVFKFAAGPAKWADDRTGAATLARKYIRKVFPDHWSFLLGEVALYSFVILLLTGVFLTIWYKPSMAEIEYEGTYQLLRGVAMSESIASTLDISFDIRGGLLIRQMHHWAAMLFVAAMLAHSLRIFFTGAFRKPREINWLIGVALLATGRHRGLRRLLPARRPAVRHRPPLRRRTDPRGPDHRHVGRVLRLRRRVPRRAASSRASTWSTSCSSPACCSA